MSALQVIGALLVALPFLALAGYIVIEMGWGELFLVFGATAVTVGVVLLGVLLLTGGIAA